MLQPPELTEATYRDAMAILIDLHGWRLSEPSIAAAYAQVARVPEPIFTAAFDRALSKTGYYKPADFIGEVRGDRRQAAATPTMALPPAPSSPDAAMWVRLRKQLAYIAAHKSAGVKDWDRHWIELLRSPVTPDEITALGKITLAEILASMAGGNPSPEYSEASR